MWAEARRQVGEHVARPDRLIEPQRDDQLAVEPFTAAYHSVLSSLAVGVVNVNVSGRASFRPLTAAAPAAIVTL